MPTPDQLRLDDDRARPRLMALWWALRPLTSVVRFMQTGAHPDDETSAMLAALALRDGVTISYACSTRGEGGQNDIGTEAGADLGALRTREMERACDVLGLRLYWHSTSPDDPITDFGFSKSGAETLALWGRERTMHRFVEIIRTERPDIICPTFLDVPGQHGHHRAMTEAAHDVLALAADPGVPSDLPPWQVQKLYLPAWSGAGQAYDDDLPPPAATLVIPGQDREPMTGWTWERIGQHARAFHRTQGMGRWVGPDDKRDWPLHLAVSHVAGPDDAVWDGLPRRVADLAEVPGAEGIAGDLRAAGASIDAAVATFPNFAEVAQHALAALAAVRRAKAACPPAAEDQIRHRLEDKIVQLSHAARLALGLEARAWVGDVFLSPGATTSVAIECDKGQADSATAQLNLPKGWHCDGETVSTVSGTPPSDPYRAIYDPRMPPAPALDVSFRAHGEAVTARLPLEAEPVLLPAHRARISPEAILLNTSLPGRTVSLSLDDVAPAGARVGLTVPEGWRADPAETGFDVVMPASVAEGRYDLAVTVDDAAAARVRTISHPHAAPTACARAASVRVGAVAVAVPDVGVGYIGAGNDRVGHWLSAMGARVRDVTDAELASETALADYDTLVIGIFAMRFRGALLAAMPRLHRWVEAGGTLVTLYHRPWDNWDPATVPPRPLEIGQPSLRWRVTNAGAAVTQLAEHPVLATPNPIGPDEWAGWVKERGLYFAKSWDPAYTPLLEMADPGEAPLRGALLVGDIGAGRHVHSALLLHHQMEHLVPGAFRLMANMIARR
ncbi:MAG: PIG-L family deacetylase [Pseudomonadota bacterium]